MPEPVGCFALVLHSHIPYVLGHGTWPHGSEMLYEAAADIEIDTVGHTQDSVARSIVAALAERSAE